MYRKWVPCDCNFSYNFKPSFWNFAHVFFQVCRSARGLDMIFNFIFVTFSTLSFSYLRFYGSVDCGYFSSPTSHCFGGGGWGAQVRHHLHQSLIYFLFYSGLISLSTIFQSYLYGGHQKLLITLGNGVFSFILTTALVNFCLHLKILATSHAICYHASFRKDIFWQK